MNDSNLNMSMQVEDVDEDKIDTTKHRLDFSSNKIEETKNESGATKKQSAQYLDGLLLAESHKMDQDSNTLKPASAIKNRLLKTSE